MEVSSVANSMQKFVDRLEGLNEDGRSHILKFKNVLHQYIEDSTGRDVTSGGWNGNTVEDGFEITDEFMIQRTNEDEPQLFIKFTREQTEDFTIKKSEYDPIIETKFFFFKSEVRNYTDAVKYPVTYTQEYWINADNITIINSYKGKCS